ncbi:hypothetical protein D3C79_1010510 [compost metagenome]
MHLGLNIQQGVDHRQSEIAQVIDGGFIDRLARRLCNFVGGIQPNTQGSGIDLLRGDVDIGRRCGEVVIEHAYRIVVDCAAVDTQIAQLIVFSHKGEGE